LISSAGRNWRGATILGRKIPSCEAGSAQGSYHSSGQPHRPRGEVKTVMNNNITTVRQHLLDTLADLRNRDKPMEIERARDCRNEMKDLQECTKELKRSTLPSPFNTRTAVSRYLLILSKSATSCEAKLTSAAPDTSEKLHRRAWLDKYECALWRAANGRRRALRRFP
jgi:hypothetical protein